MFATFFYAVPPQVSIAIDVALVAVAGPAIWLWQRHQANARRDLPASVSAEPLDADAIADEPEVDDDRVLVGID